MRSEGTKSLIELSLKGRLVGQGKPTFIIAEAGSNHDGRFDQAKELIDVAAKAGADAVKFQVFRTAHLYPEAVGVVQTPAGSIDLYAFLTRPTKSLERGSGRWLSMRRRAVCSSSHRSSMRRRAIGLTRWASPRTRSPLQS